MGAVTYKKFVGRITGKQLKSDLCKRHDYLVKRMDFVPRHLVNINSCIYNYFWSETSHRSTSKFRSATFFCDARSTKVGSRRLRGRERYGDISLLSRGLKRKPYFCVMRDETYILGNSFLVITLLHTYV